MYEVMSIYFITLETLAALSQKNNTAQTLTLFVRVRILLPLPKEKALKLL